MNELKVKETEELETVESGDVIEKKVSTCSLNLGVFKKKFVKIAVIAGVIILCVLVFFATKGIYDKDGGAILESEEILTGETIESGLKNMGVLETQKYYYTHIENYKKTEKVFGVDVPLTEKSFIYSIEGYVTAGIDFASISVEKTGNKITIKLPKAKVNNSVLDENSVKMYDEENSIFNPIKVEDVTKSFADIKKKEEKKAVSKNLLKEADANAKVLVENFIRSGYDVKDCEIVFEELK